jgi:hypothetical protein
MQVLPETIPLACVELDEELEHLGMRSRLAVLRCCGPTDFVRWMGKDEVEVFLVSEWMMAGRAFFESRPSNESLAIGVSYRVCQAF